MCSWCLAMHVSKDVRDRGALFVWPPLSRSFKHKVDFVANYCVVITIRHFAFTYFVPKWGIILASNLTCK